MARTASKNGFGEGTALAVPRRAAKMWALAPEVCFSAIRNQFENDFY